MDQILRPPFLRVGRDDLVEICAVGLAAPRVELARVVGHADALLDEAQPEGPKDAGGQAVAHLVDLGYKVPQVAVLGELEHDEVLHVVRQRAARLGCARRRVWIAVPPGNLSRQFVSREAGPVLPLLPRCRSRRLDSVPWC